MIHCKKIHSTIMFAPGNMCSLSCPYHGCSYNPVWWSRLTGYQGENSASLRKAVEGRTFSPVDIYITFQYITFILHSLFQLDCFTRRSSVQAMRRFPIFISLSVYLSVCLLVIVNIDANFFISSLGLIYFHIIPRADM